MAINGCSKTQVKINPQWLVRSITRAADLGKQSDWSDPNKYGSIQHWKLRKQTHMKRPRHTHNIPFQCKLRLPCSTAISLLGSKKYDRIL
eukprot:scaffold68080_cov51-Attheya_sp.AAC.2